MKGVLLALMLVAVAVVLPDRAAAATPHAPCIERSWIPRTGMPVAEKEWRLIRLVNCAVDRWWPGAGHARAALAVADHESCLSCTYAVNYGGCGGSNCYGAWQHSGRYIEGRFDYYLERQWFRQWPVPWTNARAQAIVTIRMMAAQGGVCPAWC
jgi:hypothetical protein